MKTKNFIILISMLALSTITSASGLNATLATEDSKIIHAKNLRPFTIECDYNGGKVSFLISEIAKYNKFEKEMTQKGRNLDYEIYKINGSKVYFPDGHCIPYVNGKKEYKIIYQRFNPVTEKLQDDHIYWGPLMSIEVNNQEYSSEFPPDYKYNPYTGEKLNRLTRP